MDQQFLVGGGADGGPWCGQQLPQLHGFAGGDLDTAASSLVREVLERGVGEQPPPDDHQVIGDQRHLAHQVRGQHHGPALSPVAAACRLVAADAVNSAQAVSHLHVGRHRP